MRWNGVGPTSDNGNPDHDENGPLLGNEKLTIFSPISHSMPNNNRCLFIYYTPPFQNNYHLLFTHKKFISSFEILTY